MLADQQLSLSFLFDQSAPVINDDVVKGICIDCHGPTPLFKRSTDKYKKRCGPCEVKLRREQTLQCFARRKSGGAPSGEMVKFTCLRCDGEFLKSKTEFARKRCVSCAKEHSRESTSIKKKEFRQRIKTAVEGPDLQAKIGYTARNKGYFQKSRAKKRSKLKCLHCGVKLDVNGRRYRYCSEGCNRAAIEAKRFSERLTAHGFEAGWPEKECAECGTKFLARSHGRERRFCKRSCGTKFLLREKTRRRRAMMYTLAVFDVSPREIFERDGWKCQECGVDTPADTSGQHADNEPNMDHIIPLCRGGDHHPSNLRCLCRKCNIDKGPLLDKEWRAKKRQRAKEERAMKRLAA